VSYISRNIDAELLAWKNGKNRKPLLLRGARQVGKSSSIRELGRSFEFFVEVNFDEKKNVRELFKRDLSPRQICDELSAIFSTPIAPGRTLLFFDEIQACPDALSSLRYFYEQLPELHLAAAGSLLEFALQELPSFGVGRIRSLFLFPFCFDEYLRATGDSLLAGAIRKAAPDKPCSEAVHQKAVQKLIRFILVGGMPEVVSIDASGGGLLECQRALDDLIRSLFDDFAKYKARVPALRLREVFASAMEQTGRKFVYSRASQTATHAQIKEAAALLEMAGLLHPVTHTPASGLPLAAGQNAKHGKYLVPDTGIFQRFLKLDLEKMLLADSLAQINKGAAAELFAGLEILKNSPAGNPVSLHYWRREQHGSNAEVDYVVQRKNDIVPIEIKSGHRGTMQSLRLFIEEKNAPRGIRSSLENFGGLPRIDIIPLYALGTFLAAAI